MISVDNDLSSSNLSLFVSVHHTVVVFRLNGRHMYLFNLRLWGWLRHDLLRYLHQYRVVRWWNDDLLRLNEGRYLGLLVIAKVGDVLDLLR